MSPARVDVLIWVLVYGGLLVAVLGLSVQRSDGGVGLALMVAGGLFAAIGVLLVYVRSRMKDTP
jgi:hypothetical protein